MVQLRPNVMCPTTCGKLCCKDYEMEQLTRSVDPKEQPYMIRDVPEFPPEEGNTPLEGVGFMIMLFRVKFT